MKIVFNIAFLIVAVSLGVSAQDSLIIDKIIAQVGSETILLSEIEEVYAAEQAKRLIEKEEKCLILENMMGRGLLVNQAKLDSVIVSDDEVEAAADARISQILSFMQDPDQFKEYYGMSTVELKNRYMDDLRNQMLAERMQSTVMADVKATPDEVRTFFNTIPKDSLPYFNAEVEISEITRKPQANDASIAKALAKITDLRNQILEGADFESLAQTWSDDLNSGRAGGNLGWQSRGTFVPEFEAVAYKLAVNELSEPVLSPFGFHIIELLEKRGNRINTRHILIKPEITQGDIDKTARLLDSVRTLILNDSLTFVDAVKEYSDEDAESYSNSGRIINPRTQNSFFEIKDLETNIYFAIDTLDEGEITRPVEYKTYLRGDQAFRLLTVLSRTSPHQANLKQDYARLEVIATENKKAIEFNEWLEDKIRDTYIHIDKIFIGCPNMDYWLNLANGGQGKKGQKSRT